ncbi:hypothetical protein [Pseudomonas chlororaphis]|uniref:hypothetical protein n=1 Tax=Pseudomonas chlororaphis TaxID=587753 RepID=UPI000F6C13DD|nr:hypothetical protein [Pseudomonas chlororaphis]AZC39431.1 hypothetical protein C4K37_5066 [Pseudomonas chlororaphis subsp. piscium]AZC45983.1 hypothetical protein C4K36_5080 [Pseudomonas chlororaphis subsp. piscium]AZC52718.1 hypothetical protein C4K35_5157 [Pseudomonas chlororaphis subsp. piscium]WDG71516.1 hypothetical protein PUP65_25950 [Pseudomonas chlororaphis]WDH30700.1 hypothetical protein PUP81_08370 [Pseudomonas chlororaphis]
MQFRSVVERNDKRGTDLCYATAMGLISGVTLSGGLDKAKGAELLATLAETRASFSAAFGDKPGAPEIQVSIL